MNTMNALPNYSCGICCECDINPNKFQVINHPMIDYEKMNIKGWVAVMVCNDKLSCWLKACESGYIAHKLHSSYYFQHLNT